jgi:hypothetical protein
MLTLGSFQTWKTCSSGTPDVLPSKCLASALAKSPRSEALGVPALIPCRRCAKAQRGVLATSRIGVNPASSAALIAASTLPHW